MFSILFYLTLFCRNEFSHLKRNIQSNILDCVILSVAVSRYFESTLGKKWKFESEVETRIAMSNETFIKKTLVYYYIL